MTHKVVPGSRLCGMLRSAGYTFITEIDIPDRQFAEMSTKAKLEHPEETVSERADRVLFQFVLLGARKPALSMDGPESKIYRPIVTELMALNHSVTEALHYACLMLTLILLVLVILTLRQ